MKRANGYWNKDRCKDEALKYISEIEKERMEINNGRSQE